MSKKLSQGTFQGALTRRERVGLFKVGDTANYQQRVPLTRGALNGMTLSNNGSDATNDIDFAAGVCRDSTDAFNIVCSALTKRLDATFAAGTNQGGLDTGAVANGTYHCFAIEDTSSEGSGDFLFSLSPTSPTMPGGYDYFRRIGSILRESGAIVAFSQNDDEFLRVLRSSDFTQTNPGTGAQTVTVKVPTGIIVNAIMSMLLVADAGSTIALLTALVETNSVPSSTLLSLWAPSAGHMASGQFRIRTNTSAQFRTRLDVSTTNTVLRGITQGWIDTRDRNG